MLSNSGAQCYSIVEFEQAARYCSTIRYLNKPLFSTIDNIGIS